jgi:hypothetical protein
LVAGVIGLIAAVTLLAAGGAWALSRVVAAHVSPGGPASVPLTFPSLPPLPAAATAPTAAELASLREVLNDEPATPGLTIDEALANRVVQALWKVREQSIDTGDVASLSDYETGAALEGDTSLIETQLCGCSDLIPRTIQMSYLFVSSQATYPSSFMAEVTTPPITDSEADVVFMVFTKATATSQWNLALETGYAVTADGPTPVYVLPAFVTGGLDNPASMPGVNLTALPGNLAAYYQYWATTDSAPSGTQFEAGSLTSTKGAELYRYGETLGVDAHHQLTYSADPQRDGEWSFAADSDDSAPLHGWVVTCGTVRYTDVTTASPGGTPLVQPPGQSTWGPTLAVGKYQKVTLSGLHETCFLNNPNTPGVVVLGGGGGTTETLGVPLAPPATQ